MVHIFCENENRNGAMVQWCKSFCGKRRVFTNLFVTLQRFKTINYV